MSMDCYLTHTKKIRIYLTLEVPGEIFRILSRGSDPGQLQKRKKGRFVLNTSERGKNRSRSNIL